MKIKKGNNRIVFTFPFLGIVIKFPIINLFRVFKTVFTGRVEGIRNKKLFKRYFEWSVHDPNSFKYALFRGLLANWSEFRFYRNTKNPFLTPTYFSLLGFVNIQKHGRECQLLQADLWCQLFALTGGKVFDDAHHFSEPHNFCLQKDKLQIFDYGSSRTHKVILEYGEKIVENFNASYCWEEEKKKIKELEKI
ncbi:MAG: hypothetical protein PHE20_01430 [Patescibacteria group bacterium]|nr:hypothetical protein [Patescibacteria group bacterium]